MDSQETRIKAGVEVASITFYFNFERQSQLGNGPLIQV